MNNIYEKLENIINIMITNDLTIGRIDNDLEPLSNEQIQQFLIKNRNIINRVIEEIINDYDKDNELFLLENPLFDWIGEYLYNYINTDF